MAARTVRSTVVTAAACSRDMPGNPNAASFKALVASSARARPSAVMTARTTRRSCADICRRTRPRCSSLLTALVTAAGCTMSRRPILPMGSDPDRLKASSRRVS